MASVAKSVSMPSNIYDQVETVRLVSGENFSEVVVRALNELLNKDRIEKFSDEALKKQYDDFRLRTAAIDAELTERAKRKEEADKTAAEESLKAFKEAALKKENELCDQIIKGE